LRRISAANAAIKGNDTVPDLSWLAVLAGLTLLTLGFLRLCDVS
jgi:hypothetical protein